MKILKYIGLGLLVIVVLFLLLGLFAPKEMNVERTIVINAPKAQVMEQVKSLKNMQKWSPWAELDSNMKNEYTGNDGEVGSKNSWTGNDQVGTGSQTITAVAENRVDLDLDFLEPFESHAKVYYTLAEEGAGTKVTWGFKSSSAYPMNGLMMLMGMEGMLSKDFDKGLAKLKALCESMPAPVAEAGTSSYEIHEMTMEPKSYIAKRAMVGFTEFNKFYGDNFPAIAKAMGMSQLTPAGAPSGIIYKWDEAAMKADMAAAMPVADAKVKVKGYETITVAGGKALHVAYYGNYDNSKVAHDAIAAYMKEKNMEIAGEVIEEYATDPMSEPDTTKWLTNIYYLVK